jgi:hypothetical protein
MGRVPCWCWPVGAAFLATLHLSGYWLPTLEVLPGPHPRPRPFDVREPTVLWGAMELPAADTLPVLFAVPFWCGVGLLAVGFRKGALVFGVLATAGAFVHAALAGITNNYFPFRLLIGYYVWYASLVLLVVVSALPLLNRGHATPLPPPKP